MNHTAPKDVQHRNKDLLTTLPNELLVHITELLPVREICRLRGQNRHLQSFIDTNEHLLVKDVIKHHRNRVHTEHRLLTDLADCDIFDALQRYYSHYGDVRVPASALKIRWNKSKGVDQLVSTPSFMYVFAKFQTAETPKRRHHWRQRLQRARLELVAPTLDQPGLEALFKKLLLEPVAGHVAYPKMPLVFHTTRIITPAPWLAFEADDIPGGGHDAQDALFHKILGLPLLDSGRSLAFCSDDVRTVVALDMIASGPSTMLQKADILQNIYIW